MEADEDGVIAKNTYGGPLLLRMEFESDGTETTYQYMYNAHGDVVTLISEGDVAATYYYDSFGNIMEQTGEVSNSILYAGYQYDEETGLYYINARMYDPVTARFLQADTYLGNINDPLSLNLYTYCLNNPHKYVDPSGHSVLLAFLLVTAVSGLLGAGMEYVSQKYIEKRDVINYDLILFEGVFNAVIGAASMGMANVGVAAARQAGKLTFRTIAKTVAKGVALGAVEGAIENAGRQMVTGTSLSNLDYGEVASSAGLTGVIGGMGAAAGVGLDMLKQTRTMRKLTSGVKGKITDAANVLKGRKTGKYFRELDLQFFAGDEVYKTATGSRGAGKYHTFFEFTLDDDFLYASDSIQFRQANKKFMKKLDSDTLYKKRIFKKNPEIVEWMKNPNLSNSPTNFTWHHSEEKGVLRLVDRMDHSINFSIYHPTGKGGRDIWGGGSLGRKGKLDKYGNLK